MVERRAAWWAANVLSSVVLGDEMEMGKVEGVVEHGRPHAGPVELCDGVYLVAGPTLSHPWDAHAYLVTAGSEPVLIDCGSLEGAGSLHANLASLGVAPADVVRVIATHGHWDHVSGLDALRTAGCTAPLALHPADRRAVESGDRLRTAAFRYGAYFPSLVVEEEIVDEQVIDLGDGATIEVVHTPGHSPGSVCLIVDAGGHRILLAGDTLWGGYHPQVGSDIDAWHASLDRLLSRSFDLLSAGHARPEAYPNARDHVLEARRQLGVYFDPWCALDRRAG